MYAANLHQHHNLSGRSGKKESVPPQEHSVGIGAVSRRKQEDGKDAVAQLLDPVVRTCTTPAPWEKLHWSP